MLAGNRDHLGRGGVVQEEDPLRVAGLPNGALDTCGHVERLDAGVAQERGKNMGEASGIEVRTDVDGLAFAEGIDGDRGITGIAAVGISGEDARRGRLQNIGPEAGAAVGRGERRGELNGNLLIVEGNIVFDGGAR